MHHTRLPEGGYSAALLLSIYKKCCLRKDFRHSNRAEDVDGAKPWSCDHTLYLDKIALRLHRLITTSMYALFIRGSAASKKARLGL